MKANRPDHPYYEAPTVSTWHRWVALAMLAISPFAIGWYLLTKMRLRVQVRTFAFEIGPAIRRSHQIVFSSFTAYAIQGDGPVQWQKLPLMVRLARPGRFSVQSALEMCRKEKVLCRGRVGIRLFTPWQKHPDERVLLSGMYMDVGPVSMGWWRCKPPKKGI